MFDPLVQQCDIIIGEGQLASIQRKQYNPTRPYINRGPLILLLTDNLRRRIVRTPTSSLQQFPIFHNIRQPKIPNLDQIIRINQNILRLQISVRDMIPVYIFDPVDYLFEVEFCLFLGDFLVLDVVEELAVVCELHYDEDVVCCV